MLNLKKQHLRKKKLKKNIKRINSYKPEKDIPNTVSDITRDAFVFEVWKFFIISWTYTDCTLKQFIIGYCSKMKIQHLVLKFIYT